ncbi:MAG TPA: LytR C-terminal domain-containing protein, partial [Acidimicrobiales bacterium]|nr:LytR C-terminal domain-containing protein [Acidimicrobiales bacterium]
MSRRPAGARGRSSDAPGGNTTRGIVLLAVAVALGILILNRTDEGVSTGDVRIETPTTAEDTTTVPSPPTTLRPLRSAADVKVLAANGSKVSGLARRTADQLKAKGYTNTLAPTDTTRDVEATSVEFAADFEPEARAVAEALGLPPTVVKPLDSPPVADTRGADVVVLIGPDLPGATGTTTAAGPATTAAASGTGTGTG